MNLRPDILQIEAKLKAAGIPLRELLSAAEIDRSTWTRWRAGTNGATLTNWNAVQGAADRLLLHNPSGSGSADHAPQ